MKKVNIYKKDGTLRSPDNIYDDPTEWINNCITNNSWGKGERWILADSEFYDPSDVLQTEERISDNTGESTSWVLLKADYTIEIIDLDQDYEWLLSECHRKRKEEYPPLSELGDALYWKENGDPSKYDLYIKKCDEVKKKYPLPLKKEII